MRLATKLDEVPFIFGQDQFPFYLDNKGKFVTVIQPSQLLQALSTEQYANDVAGPAHQFARKFKLDRIKEKDNPILLVYNIKEK
jgi:hypothetical protein